MPYCDSGMRTKLQINNAPRLRHYWVTSLKRCDCGCFERVFVHNWICLEKLREIMNDQGYSIEKNYDKKEE